MNALAEMVVAMIDALPIAAGDPEDGLRLAVTSLDVAFPIEASLGERGDIVASAPRGRLATGFDLPHGRITARFTVEEEEA